MASSSVPTDGIQLVSQFLQHVECIVKQTISFLPSLFNLFTLFFFFWLLPAFRQMGYNLSVNFSNMLSASLNKPFPSFLPYLIYLLFLFLFLASSSVPTDGIQLVGQLLQHVECIVKQTISFLPLFNLFTLFLFWLLPAFRQMGYNLSVNFSNMIIYRFDVAGRRSLTLDNFIQSCVMLKSLTDAFKQRDKNMSGSITINYEDFLTLAVHNKA